MIEQISLISLKRYLVSQGWLFSESKNPAFDLLIFNQGRKSGRLYLPKTDEIDDLTDRVKSAIQAAAQILEVPFEKILEGISSHSDAMKDIISLRVKRNTLLDVDQAADIICLMRDLVSFAAVVEHRPVPHFLRAAPIGKKFAKRSLFGHTKSGSFVFTIEAPIVEIGIPGSGSHPFTRRVVERILRGILSARKASENKNYEAATEQFSFGLNANLMEVIAGLYRASSSDGIEFSVKWSKLLPPSEDLRELEPVLVNEFCASFIEGVADRLKKQVPPEVVTIEGTVSTLSSDDISALIGEEPTSAADEWPYPQSAANITSKKNNKEGFNGLNTIKLTCITAKNKTLKVIVQLGADDYNTALIAHGSRKRLSISGYLRREFGRAYLDEPHEIHIVE